MTALLAFERAASHRSFQIAAKDLSLSPSAISHQIRGLEESFGVRLFARAGRSVRLTPAGEKYFQVAKSILEELDLAGRDLLSTNEARRYELRVSSLPFFTSTVIMPSLGTLNRYHPSLSLRLEATHQYADFDSSGVDVAIRFGKTRSRGLKFEPLLRVQSVPVCHPDIAQGLDCAKKLSESVLIHVSAMPHSWSKWLSAMGEGDLTPAGELWVDSVPAALEAAEHGHGVALGMSPLIYRRPDHGKKLVTPLDPAGQESTLYMVVRPEQAGDRIICAFRRWLINAVECAK